MPAIVTGVAVNASQQPVSGMVVTAELVAPLTMLLTDADVVAQVQTVTAQNGSWSLTLTAASEMVVPDMAGHTITVGNATYTGVMPDKPGTYTLASLIDPPQPPPPPPPTGMG